MSAISILPDEFEEAAAMAGLRARQNALAAGHSVVFVDESGRYVQELPDGRRFEIRLQAGNPQVSHVVVLRELPALNK
ncbi:MAG: MmgE/PrpD family protein [Bryobacteraceae bacterium]